MKKILLLVVLTCSSYLAFSNAVVTQKEWRWRKDNGSETSADWISPQYQGPSIPLCTPYDTIRIRIGFDVAHNTGSPNPTSTLGTSGEISYATSSTGPWTIINTTNGNAFVMTASAHVVNGATTTQQLVHATTGVFTPGQFVDVSNVGGLTFNAVSGESRITEHEWVIKPTEHVQAITYFFKLNDLDNPSAPVQITFTAAPAISAGAVATDISCYDNGDGSIHLTPSGGTGPYTYEWLPGKITTQNITGLGAGTYSVTVTDANGCTGTASETISEPTFITASISASTDVSCHNGSNGSATVTASGGTGTLEYSWSPSGGTAATASGLVAGSYTVTVTDENGCEETATEVITQPTAISVSVTQDVTGCTGSNESAATATATGGTGLLAYSWSPSGGTSASAMDLAPGTYTVTVTDENSCEGTEDITITETVCTGINSSSELTMNINLYPNPTTKDRSVSVNSLSNLKIEKITLMNSHGSKILTSSDKAELMIQNVEAGIYMVEIVTDKGTAMKKLVVE